MTRTKTIKRKEISDAEMPSKSNLRRHTRAELDDIIIRLAEAHGIRV